MATLLRMRPPAVRWQVSQRGLGQPGLLRPAGAAGGLVSMLPPQRRLATLRLALRNFGGLSPKSCSSSQATAAAAASVPVVIRPASEGPWGDSLPMGKAAAALGYRPARLPAAPAHLPQFLLSRMPELEWFPRSPPQGTASVLQRCAWRAAQVLAVRQLRQEHQSRQLEAAVRVEQACWNLLDAIQKSVTQRGAPATTGDLLPNQALNKYFVQKIRLLRLSLAYRGSRADREYWQRHLDPAADEEQIKERTERNLALSQEVFEGLLREHRRLASDPVGRWFRLRYLCLLAVLALGLWMFSGLNPYLPPWMGREFSRMWGMVAEVELGPLVYLWGRTVGVNFEEAEFPVEAYPTLQALFTRNLKPGTHTVDTQADLVCPADSTVVALGDVTPDLVMNIKGQPIPVNVFLGREAIDESQPARRLKYAVLYLAPKAYHWFHSPSQFEVRGRLHFPGTMYSVHPAFVGKVGRVWTDNERVVLEGRWPHGEMYYGAVGAFNVGSIAIDIEPELRTNAHDQQISFRPFPVAANLEKAGRVGGFRMGSSIVLVFDAPAEFEFTAEVGQEVRVGQALGRVGEARLPSP